MDRMRLVRPCIAAVLLFLALLASAEPIPSIKPTSYVTDLAGVLDASTKQKLERLAAEVEQKTGAQLAIVTVHSLEGTTVDDYAVELFKRLGVGKKDNRGVLILLSPDERRYRVEVGYGLEPVINDARAGDIGRSMVPSLRARDYNNAILLATTQVAQLIAADKGVTLDGIPQRRQTSDSGGGFPWWLFPLGFVIFWIIIRSIGRGGRGGRGGGRGVPLWPLLFMNSGGGWGGGSGWSSGGGFGGSSGGFGGGSGGFGGFGGFGGGGSGGGGASGSW
jgi:uncharacterized protein